MNYTPPALTALVLLSLVSCSGDPSTRGIGFSPAQAQERQENLVKQQAQAQTAHDSTLASHAQLKKQLAASEASLARAKAAHRSAVSKSVSPEEIAKLQKQVTVLEAEVAQRRALVLNY